jgi:hypothetical protein
MVKRKKFARPWRGGGQRVRDTEPIAARRAKDEIDQTDLYLINTHGSMWMRGYFDRLPLSVRRRLRDAPFNLCPACLVTEFLPKVQRQHPNYSRERALFAAIEAMEAEVRKGGPRPWLSARLPSIDRGHRVRNKM